MAAWPQPSWRHVGQSAGRWLQAAVLGCAARSLREHQPRASYAECRPHAARTRTRTRTHTRANIRTHKHSHMRVRTYMHAPRRTRMRSCTQTRTHVCTHGHACPHAQARSCPLSTRMLGSRPVLTSSLLLQMEQNQTARLFQPGRIILSLSKGSTASKWPGLPEPGHRSFPGHQLCLGDTQGGRSWASESGFHAGPPPCTPPGALVQTTPHADPQRQVYKQAFGFILLTNTHGTGKGY